MDEQGTVIRNGRIVRHDRVVDGDLVMEGGVITHLGPSANGTGARDEVDAAGCFVLPGFVDIHVHGGVGFDLTSGLFDPESKSFDPDESLYDEMLPKVAAHFARHGVTFALLATVAAPEERLMRVLALMADHVQGLRNGVDGSYLGGTFIEGTFVKDRRYAGAQNADHFREPSIDLFERLNEAARGTIRYVNVVPEFGKKACELTRALSEKGVLVGAGHTGCTATQYLEAVENGLRTAVHLTNGPTGSSFKPFDEGGALQAALRSPQVFAELIVDGYHVFPGYVRDIIRRKGPYRVCIITDAMFASGAEGITDFEVSGVRGQASDNGEYLCVVDAENTLFGSCVRMDVEFANLLSYLTCDMPGVWNHVHEALPLQDALAAAVKMCCTNPARVVGLLDDPRKATGTMEPGKWADIVLGELRGEPGRYEFQVRKLFARGREVDIGDGGAATVRPTRRTAACARVE